MTKIPTYSDESFSKIRFADDDGVMELDAVYIERRNPKGFMTERFMKILAHDHANHTSNGISMNPIEAGIFLEKLTQFFKAHGIEIPEDKEGQNA